MSNEGIGDSNAPGQGYGGSRNDVRLTSIADTKEYTTDRSGDLPWGLRDD